MRTVIVSALALCLGLSGAQALAQDSASFTESVEGLDRQDGLIALYPDPAQGRVLAALTPQGDGTLGRMIYTARLTSGLGSNPVGLDRGLGRPTSTRTTGRDPFAISTQCTGAPRVFAWRRFT